MSDFEKAARLNSVQRKAGRIKKLIDLAIVQLELAGEDGLDNAEANLNDALGRLEDLMMEEF